MNALPLVWGNLHELLSEVLVNVSGLEIERAEGIVPPEQVNAAVLEYPPLVNWINTEYLSFWQKKPRCQFGHTALCLGRRRQTHLHPAAVAPSMLAVLQAANLSEAQLNAYLGDRLIAEPPTQRPPRR